MPENIILKAKKISKKSDGENYARAVRSTQYCSIPLLVGKGFNKPNLGKSAKCTVSKSGAFLFSTS